MTAICPSSGPSAARPGFGAAVAVSASSAGALLTEVPIPWVVPLAAYLGLVTYELTTFCTTDPPSLPSITAADALALITIADPVGHYAALLKFHQFLGHFAWYTFCECTTGATPSPSIPSSPTGLPALAPPVGSLSQLACDNFSVQNQLTFGFHDAFNIASGVGNLPGVGPWTAVLTLINNADGSTNGSVDYTLQWLNSSNGIIRTDKFPGSGLVASGTSQTHTLGPSPAGTATYASFMDAQTAGQDNTCVLQTRLYCGGLQPGTAQAACCPADPYLQAQVQQILDLVTLIQRQAVPFAYVTSTVHTGLTGSGSISVQGLIGARVLLTTTPTNVGIQAGDPDVVWEAGWINWGTADGFLTREFVDTSPMLSFPRDAGQYTTIGYSLSAGVVVSIEELTREP